MHNIKLVIINNYAFLTQNRIFTGGFQANVAYEVKDIYRSGKIGERHSRRKILQN